MTTCRLNMARLKRITSARRKTRKTGEAKITRIAAKTSHQNLDYKAVPLTASLFEPFDDSDFDLESPIKTKECPTKADGLNKILVDDLSYLPHDRRLKQKKKGDDNEEVVDASGGLTTSLNSIHKGVHSANIRGMQQGKCLACPL